MTIPFLQWAGSASGRALLFEASQVTYVAKCIWSGIPGIYLGVYSSQSSAV